MAGIKKAYTIALKIIGDGSSTTYAVTMNTDSYDILSDASGGGSAGRKAQNSVWPLVPTPTGCLPGKTAGGIAYTGSISTETLTFTFASAPPGADSLVAILTA